MPTTSQFRPSASESLRPQALIFTLFGDYIRLRGERIWIGSLIKLLSLFEISEPAVRSAVSRMVRRGWLKIERVRSTSYYAPTPQAKRLLAEGAERIFHFPQAEAGWDGCWQIVTYSIPEKQRSARDALRAGLAWLGFGMLANATWVSPRDQRFRVEELATSLKIKPCVQIFRGSLEGFISCQELVARCWDLASINAEYAAFLKKYEEQFRDFQEQVAAGQTLDGGDLFARRFMLIHEYRRFPYRDPRLPAELLPADWHGEQAAALFQKYHRLLADGANAYFESVFQ